MQKITVTVLLLLPMVMFLGCGDGGSGFVEMPDNPIPKPDTVTLYGDDGEVTK